MKILYVNQKRMVLLTLSVFFIMAGCATTRVTSDWKDVSYQKKPEKILVLALVNDTTQRRIMEDDLVTGLKSAGVAAIPGYAELPEGKPDKQAVAAKVRELGADAVLTTRLLDKKTVQEYVPGTAYYPPPGYYDFYNYYGGFYPPYAPGYAYPPGYATGGVPPYPPGYTPGYTRETVYSLAEANLYDAATGKLVWSARTETELQGNDKKAIQSYSSEIVKTLRKQKLVG